jgi:hypothetical protein
VTSSILAMVGECSGNVRSTPTPNDTLQAAAAAPDHNTLEHLDPFATCFGHAGVNPDGIARPEVRQVFAQARLFDEIDLVHDGTSVRSGGCGGQS